MPDSAWKACERRICSLFGGSRRGPDGYGQSDCVGTVEAVQVKRSKRGVPEGRWIEAAKRHGSNEKKDWVLVVVRPGQHAENAIVVCSLDYLLRLRHSDQTLYPLYPRWDSTSSES